MKKIFNLFLFLLSFCLIAKSQNTLCSDSSYRLKYLFADGQVHLYNNTKTIGSNFYSGKYESQTSGNNGIVFLKTTWGDDILFYKKYFSPGLLLYSNFSFPAPQQSFICSGKKGVGVNTELLLTKVDTAGNIQWANTYKLGQGHLGFKTGYGNNDVKNIVVTQNAIYLNGIFNPDFATVCKLDLNGNLIWCRSFHTNLGIASSFDAPIIKNGQIIFQVFKNDGYPTYQQYFIITVLDEQTGTILESNSFKAVANNQLDGLIPKYLHLNSDGTFTLLGYTTKGPSIFINQFNVLIDQNFYTKKISYLNSSVIFQNSFEQSDFNNADKYASISTQNLSQKYISIFDFTGVLLKTKKFTLPNIMASPYPASVNLDDKQNLHFLFHYPEGNRFVAEYARISDFAPNSTPGCFGKDTSILTPVPFTLTREPFTWDLIDSTNTLIATPVNFISEPATVTKELVCKEVSRCDSIDISGPIVACVNQPLRYTLFKNNLCLKERQWDLDTSLVNILSYEADSAVNLSFKRAYSGYLRAHVYNCVVQDSLFVTVASPAAPIKLLKPDSLLCPGKSLTLTAKPGYKIYSWQDGSTLATYNVSQAGFYKITATDSCGNVSADSVRIGLADTSFAIQQPAAICLYDTARIMLPGGISNLAWQPNGYGLQKNNVLLLYPPTSTNYTLQAIRYPGCSIQAQVAVTVKACPDVIYMPSAFTPNADGLNDRIKPIVTGSLLYYRFEIFNRYGQKLFSTENPSLGWDGKIKGALQPTGAFAWQVTYRFRNGEQKIMKGTFLLLH